MYSFLICNWSTVFWIIVSINTHLNNTKNNSNYVRNSQSSQLLLPAPEPPRCKTNVTSSSQTAFGRKSKRTSSRPDIKSLHYFVNTIPKQEKSYPGRAGSRIKEWEEKWPRNKWQYLRLRPTVCTGGTKMLQHNHSDNRLKEKLDMKVTKPFLISSINFFASVRNVVSAQYQKCQWHNGNSKLELRNQTSILANCNLREYRRRYVQMFIFSPKVILITEQATWVVKNIHNFAGWRIWCIKLAFQGTIY